MDDRNAGQTPEQTPVPGHKALIEKEQKQVTRIYAAMVAMLIFSCIPSAVLQVIAILLMFYVMISAYTLRAGTPEDSMVRNHMTFLIRTFWISSLFFLIGFVADLIYLVQKIDIGMIQAMSDTFLATGRVSFDMPGLRLMATASLITLGPSLIYFVYRVAKGLARALKGYRMNDVNAWF